jgi:hypothetical protein
MFSTRMRAEDSRCWERRSAISRREAMEREVSFFWAMRRRGMSWRRVELSFVVWGVVEGMMTGGGRAVGRRVVVLMEVGWLNQGRFLCG